MLSVVFFKVTVLKYYGIIFDDFYADYCLIFSRFFFVLSIMFFASLFDITDYPV